MNRVFPSLMMLASLAISVCLMTVTPTMAASTAWLDPPGIVLDVTDSEAMLTTADHIDMLLDQGFPGVGYAITNEVTRVDYTCLLPGGEGSDGPDAPDPAPTPPTPNPDPPAPEPGFCMTGLDVRI